MPITSPLTKAMLRWAFKLPPEDAERDYPDSDWHTDEFGPELRERHAAYKRRHRAGWAGQGRCRGCGREIEAERSHLVTCGRCAQSNNASAARKRLRWKNDPEVCGQCGVQRDDPSRLVCSTCRRRRSIYRYGDRPAGAPPRCKDCGNLFDGGKRVCDPCAERRRIYKAERRRRGVSHNSA